jgi:hypothetical protein
VIFNDPEAENCGAEVRTKHASPGDKFVLPAWWLEHCRDAKAVYQRHMDISAAARGESKVRERQLRVTAAIAHTILAGEGGLSCGASIVLKSGTELDPAALLLGRTQFR